MGRCRGFSLIEVLVTLVLTAIGILGMLALQTKSIQYTQDAVNRNTAITLANDLFEIMRTHRAEFFQYIPPQSQTYSQLKSSTALYNADGSLKLSAASCPASRLPQNALEQGHCWLKALETYLPGGSEADIQSQLKLCPSYKTGQCADSSYIGSSIELQIAWRARQGDCLQEADDSDDSVCNYSARIEL